MATTVSDITDQTKDSQWLAVVDQPEDSRSMEAVTTSSGHVDVPLPALTSKLKSKRKKRVHLFKMSCETRPIPISSSSRDDVGCGFTQEML